MIPKPGSPSESALQSSSTSRASPYPFASPIGRTEPCKAAPASVVGWPDPSRAHPAGIVVSPLETICLMRDRATTAVAISSTIGSAAAHRNACADRVGSEQGRDPAGRSDRGRGVAQREPDHSAPRGKVAVIACRAEMTAVADGSRAESARSRKFEHEVHGLPALDQAETVIGIDYDGAVACPEGAHLPAGA